MKIRKENISVNVILKLYRECDLIVPLSDYLPKYDLLESFELKILPELRFIEKFDGSLEVMDNRTQVIVNEIVKLAKTSMSLQTERLFYLQSLPSYIVEDNNTSPENLERIKNVFTNLKNII